MPSARQGETELPLGAKHFAPNHGWLEHQKKHTNAAGGPCKEVNARENTDEDGSQGVCYRDSKSI